MNDKKETIVSYDIQITWNNGEKEFRSDVPFIKSLEHWLDAIEQEEGENENDS
jgi:hypothetical protein